MLSKIRRGYESVDNVLVTFSAHLIPVTDNTPPNFPIAQAGRFFVGGKWNGRPLATIAFTNTHPYFLSPSSFSSISFAKLLYGNCYKDRRANPSKIDRWRCSRRNPYPMNGYESGLECQPLYYHNNTSIYSLWISVFYESILRNKLVVFINHS